MDTSLERIRAEIIELEAKIADLRIAEREIQALEKLPARKTRPAPGPKPKPKRKPEASNQAEVRQTIGSAIADVLGRRGALSAAEIAEHTRATGRDISRTVSFSLAIVEKARPRKERGRQVDAAEGPLSASSLVMEIQWLAAAASSCSRSRAKIGALRVENGSRDPATGVRGHLRGAHFLEQVRDQRFNSPGESSIKFKRLSNVERINRHR